MRAEMNRLITGSHTVIIMGAMCCPTEPARPRRPSAAQIKQMQERSTYIQQEMVRYQTEAAAKERPACGRTPSESRPSWLWRC